jgi:acyl-CoA synthetase (AMP-forming)/AMP-acid ligase II
MTGTVAEAVRAAARFGDRDAVLDGGLRLTYAEFTSQIRRTAAAYLAHGVGPGDRVCVWAPNRVEWLLAALGAQYVGAVLVPLNTRYRGHEAADVLRRTRASVLVVAQGFLGTDYLGLLRSAGADLPDLRTTLLLGDDGPAGKGDGLPWAEFLAAAGTVDPARVEELADAVGPDDMCDILFTSGTTGRSKGAFYGHRQTLGNALVWAEHARVGPDDRYLIVNPFFHSFGYKAGFIVCLLRGALVVSVPTFDVGQVLDLIEQEGVTIFPGPPAIYQTLLDDPSLPARDLSSLRLAVTGAAMVPETLVARINRDLRLGTTLTAYGLTEAPVVTMCRQGDDDRTVATTSGTPVEGVELRTVDGKGAPTPPGTPGEVLVRGPNMMRGYLDDPAATAATIDADGWLHTGDVGIVDERGYLRITDRIKDMFSVGGFNVYPAEVEQVLTAHPTVRECAVIGVPDHRLGEVGVAYVCARAGTAVDPDELIAYCKDRLANFKVPRAVTVLDALPRNAGGKVAKLELREAYDAASAAARS